VDAEFAFRGHARELLERVAAGHDTRPATAAECCVAMAEVAMAIPLHGAAAGFYLRMWQQAFPSHPDCDPSLAAHYERAHGPGIDRHERYVRRRLAVPGRRLDPARIECDGEHWGRALRLQIPDGPDGGGLISVADLSEVPCAGGDGACPFAGECDYDARCHCLCYAPCDEECGDELCAAWREALLRVMDRGEAGPH
jgi:hypothetical protein